MPYKSDFIKLPEHLDRRIKISKSEYPKILKLYQKKHAIRKIARMYKVNPRLIHFILFPNRKKKNLEDREKRGGWKLYYKGGPEWAEIIREHRQYKHRLHLAGKI